jgi:ketosteroid isomerase-like protein
MKKLWLLTVLTVLFIVFLLGSATPLTAQMTSQEQETVKKEITEAVGTIFTNLQNLDAEALYQSYAESTDFIQITTAGEMADFQTAKHEHANWFMTLSSLKVMRVSEAFRFLPGNTVIYYWFGKFEMTTKNGVQLKMDKFGTTFIFSKKGNQWKVILQQASSLPPVPVKE